MDILTILAENLAKNEANRLQPSIDASNRYADRYAAQRTASPTIRVRAPYQRFDIPEEQVKYIEFPNPEYQPNNQGAEELNSLLTAVGAGVNEAGEKLFGGYASDFINPESAAHTPVDILAGLAAPLPGAVGATSKIPTTGTNIAKAAYAGKGLRGAAEASRAAKGATEVIPEGNLLINQLIGEGKLPSEAIKLAEATSAKAPVVAAKAPVDIKKILKLVGLGAGATAVGVPIIDRMLGPRVKSPEAAKPATPAAPTEPAVQPSPAQESAQIIPQDFSGVDKQLSALDAQIAAMKGQRFDTSQSDALRQEILNNQRELLARLQKSETPQGPNAFQRWAAGFQGPEATHALYERYLAPQRQELAKANSIANLLSQMSSEVSGAEQQEYARRSDELSRMLNAVENRAKLELSKSGQESENTRFTRNFIMQQLELMNKIPLWKAESDKASAEAHMLTPLNSGRGGVNLNAFKKPGT